MKTNIFGSLHGRGDGPTIQRMRHAVKRRNLDVAAVERLTPHMIRVTLAGADLEGFVSASPDDHIKIFIPDHHGEGARRDYTPRRYDPQAGTLVLDFVDHDGGPAAAWARAARIGDRLEIGGPRGSQVIAGPVERWLLIGDETALPAIGRRVEELSAHERVTTLVAVPGAGDEQVWTTSARHDPHWVHRPMEEADQARSVLDRLAGIDIPDRTFVWVGAEASVAKAVRRYLLEDRGIGPSWIKASGYWVKGTADASVKDVGEGA